MALDESRDNDEIFEVDGFNFVVNKDFLEQAKPIKVDYTPMGFSITSSIEMPKGDCGGCSGGSCG